MAHSGRLVLLLQLICWVSVGLACFCERYPWGSWTACSRSCNHGTQRRLRTFQHDDGYYWKNSCPQLCQKYDRRACNEQRCPINCQLTEFGFWSDCSPCARKQFRTRSVVRPSQFGGSACSVVLTEERPCHPSSECKLPPIDCRDDLKCDNGRCINSTLTCNKQNDCGDNSDERDCAVYNIVCPTEKRVAPGADLVGNGFDVLAQEPRGAVLDNMFMGAICRVKRPRSTLLYHRIPHNFESFDIKVGELEDFLTEPHPLRSESINVKNSINKQSLNNAFIPFYLLFNNGIKDKTAVEASKKMDSKFLRVHQVLPVSTFQVKDPGDLVLSLPFLQFLNALPLEYNYALYREIFQRFGTHYYSSGKLGGHYDLLYQYSRVELTSSGDTEEYILGCLSKETTSTAILYSGQSGLPCGYNKMTQKYQGSYIQAAEKSFSMVRGGRTREAAALAWDRDGQAPDRTFYKNWAKSVLDNPNIVESKVLPILDLVRGIPCAVTKRRHLRKALLQYLDEFDTCKCAPCPNNAIPVLSGTECMCVCQTGTFGISCEKRAPDFTSEEVDGYWSCWGPWSRCGATMKRHRTRQCDNPSPLRGGRNCEGADRQEDPCYISIFEKQETCDNDDDFSVGWRDELPPGVHGCLRPQRPANSFLRKAKQYYSFGEDEEFQCFTGFELEGFQFTTCHPDGTWSQSSGTCTRKLCLPPEIPDGMMLFPNTDEYKVGESMVLNCNEMGLFPQPSGTYTCSNSLSWEPPLPADLRCTDENPFVPDSRCRPGENQQGSKCVCIQRDSCLQFDHCSHLESGYAEDTHDSPADSQCGPKDPYLPTLVMCGQLFPCDLVTQPNTHRRINTCCQIRLQPDVLCVLNMDVGVTVPMSLCSFYAGRCHGDPLLFVSKGTCDAVDSAKLEWIKFRGQMSSKSSVQEPCGLDTCYDWEKCSESQSCVCRAARDCPREEETTFCVKLSQTQRTRSMGLCSMAALKCASYQFEIVNDGVCQ